MAAPTGSSSSLAVPTSPGPSAATSKRSRSRDSSLAARSGNNTPGAHTPARTPAGSTPSLIIPQTAPTNPGGDPLEADSTPYPAFLRLSRADVVDRFNNLEYEQRVRLLEGAESSKQQKKLAKKALGANGESGTTNDVTENGSSVGLERPEPVKSPWTRCSGSEVSIRNRYINVDPYENNRVKLLVPEGHSDYINASPIVLESHRTRRRAKFIATQGPKHEILSHIWRMTYQSSPPSDPAVIVMLTQTHEAGREKCFPYYPRSPSSPVMRVNEHNEFDDSFTHDVRLVGLTHNEEARTEVRELEMVPASASEATEMSGGVAKGVPNIGGDQEEGAVNGTEEPQPQQHTTMSSSQQPAKKVWHLLFGGWPDFSVPCGADRTALLQLIKLSRTLNTPQNPKQEGEDENPRIVHCSAGVGRSGTFIALDFLLSELASGAFDDMADDDDPVLATVDSLRKQRMMMVQGEMQYAFIYEVLREAWRARWEGLHGDESVVRKGEPMKKKARSEKSLDVGIADGQEADEDEHAEKEVEEIEGIGIAM